MEAMKKQAQQLGVDIRFGIATGVDFSSSPRKVTIDGRKIVETDAVIIATGAQAKYLGLESETLFKGQGVSACATCDGFFYRNQDVIVVGGGDSACEEATYLASICNKVYNTVQVLGDQNGVTGALVRHSGGEELVIDATGFFLAIGHTPNTAVFKGALELDAEGYIRTEPGTSRTSVPGVFAAGDVQDPHYRQAITAAGSGCMAALDCERYLLGL